MRLALALAVLAAPAWAYDNPRFGFALDVPAGFERVAESDNGDGATFRAGDAELLAWGSYLSVPFEAEVADRVAAERADGFAITYQAGDADGASWSGEDGTRIVYARAIPLCDGAAGFFRLEYPEADKAALDPVVEALVERFRATCG